jgi:hypothetical protein
LMAPSWAQWKWRDKDGRITVSDRAPPPGVADKDILARPNALPARAAAAPAPAVAATPAGVTATPAPAASAPPTALEREVQARRRAAEEEKAAKAKAEEEKQAARRADNCSRARSQMATMESGQRVARVNDKGEREFLDDAARARELQRARDIVSSDCR